MRHEVIFQVHSGNRWLDWCRETSPHTYINPTNNWAKEQCDRLEKETGKLFRFIVEIWN